MKKEIGEAFRRQFDARMKQKLPQFREVKPAERKGLVPGSRAYCCQAAPELSFFLILVPSIMESDRFTLDGAWSTGGRVPSQLSFLTDQPDGSHRFRLPALWNVPHGDYWWELSDGRHTDPMTADEFDEWLHNHQRILKERIEEGLRKARGCVDQAIDRIVEYALPYFDGIAKARGYPSLFAS
jgi:hypothetical protein